MWKAKSNGVRGRTAAKRSLNVVLTGAKSLSNRSTQPSDIVGKILVLVPFQRVDQWGFKGALCVGLDGARHVSVMRKNALQKV